MRLDLRYLGRSEVRSAPGGVALAFAPNLARPKVHFDGEVANPVRFREAVSALHDVVVGDLRFRPKDKSAYEQWKKNRVAEEDRLRRHVATAATADVLASAANRHIPADLEAQFHRMHSLYWTARRRWASELAASDPEMFRHLVPCDPVVTVAPDVVFFECFSKDESSYGWLDVDRDAFRGGGDAGIGTTNVDYSLDLYEHFQTLRSYRPTRLVVDPTGFEVRVEGRGDHREEKIDLPSSWLRGFGQLQAAMCLPSRTIAVSREALYSVLAFLGRHREKTGPRSLRFRLEPGRRPTIVLDPWGVEVECHGEPYGGERAEEIKVWGRRRLFALARLLPLAERVDVRLLGSGLPSVWVVSMGEMRFTLALSGWTTNDWAAGANLDLLASAYAPSESTAARIGHLLARHQSATVDRLAQSLDEPHSEILGGLHLLAKRGQAIFDFTSGVYRFRSVMSEELSDAVLGPEHPELVAGRSLFADGRVRITRDETPSPMRRLVVAEVGDTAVEALFDPDNGFARARCTCSFFYKSRLRAGPCRHLLALRLQASGATRTPLPNEAHGERTWWRSF